MNEQDSNNNDSCHKQMRDLRQLIPPVIKLPVPIFGKAPGVRGPKLISAPGETRRFMLAFAPGDDVMAGLKDLAEKVKLRSATLQGIGALRQSAFAFFNLSEAAFETIYVDEQAEVNVLSGNISVHDGNYALHVHGSVSVRGGSTRGGHLVYAEVGPAFEMEVVETAAPLNRTHFDACTGLILLEP